LDILFQLRVFLLPLLGLLRLRLELNSLAQTSPLQMSPIAQRISARLSASTKTAVGSRSSIKSTGSHAIGSR
jgi:hypothetical protein